MTPSREIANLIVVIRTAIESDLYPIVEFSKVCNKESSYGLPFNDSNAIDYHNKPFCYIMKFWVGLEGRKTRAARKLLESAVAWGRSEDCTHIFVTATAGLDSREQKLFINLVKKAGFVEGGPVLTLGLEV